MGFAGSQICSLEQGRKPSIRSQEQSSGIIWKESEIVRWILAANLSKTGGDMPVDWAQEQQIRQELPLAMWQT